MSEKLFIFDTVSLSHMTLGIRQNAYIQVSRVRFSYCNLGNTGSATVRNIYDARYFLRGQMTGSGDASALPVGLAPMEAKVWVPERPLPL